MSNISSIYWPQGFVGRIKVQNIQPRSQGNYSAWQFQMNGMELMFDNSRHVKSNIATLPPWKPTENWWHLLEKTDVHQSFVSYASVEYYAMMPVWLRSRCQFWGQCLHAKLLVDVKMPIFLGFEDDPSVIEIPLLSPFICGKYYKWILHLCALHVQINRQKSYPSHIVAHHMYDCCTWSQLLTLGWEPDLLTGLNKCFIGLSSSTLVNQIQQFHGFSDSVSVSWLFGSVSMHETQIDWMLYDVSHYSEENSGKHPTLTKCILQLELWCFKNQHQESSQYVILK